MNTLQQIAQNFTTEFAQGCADAGIAGWVLDLLADKGIATPAVRARWNLAEGTRECDAFFNTHFAPKFIRLAELARKHQAARAA